MLPAPVPFSLGGLFIGSLAAGARPRACLALLSFLVDLHLTQSLLNRREAVTHSGPLRGRDNTLSRLRTQTKQPPARRVENNVNDVVGDRRLFYTRGRRRAPGSNVRCPHVNLTSISCRNTIGQRYLNGSERYDNVHYYKCAKHLLYSV